MSAVPSRLLRAEEKTLIVKLLESSPARSRLVAALESVEVEDMRDGGMGSLLFRSSNDRVMRKGTIAATGTFRDLDRMEVVASVFVDQFGDLFELDLWKVDFSAILQYPAADDVTLERRER